MVSAEKIMYCLIHLCIVKHVQAIRFKLLEAWLGRAHENNLKFKFTGCNRRASSVVDSSKCTIIKQYRSVCQILIYEISGSSGPVSYTHLTLPTKLEV